MNNLCRQFYSHTLFSKYFIETGEKIVRLNLQCHRHQALFVVVGLNGFTLCKMLEEAKQKGKDYAFLALEI